MRLLIILLLLYLLYRVVRFLLGSTKTFQRHGQSGAIDEMVQDPQCKTYIPLRQAKREVIDGKEYFFCSEACAEAFKEKEKPSA
jgi:YHS domain-containing protein